MKNMTTTTNGTRRSSRGLWFCKMLMAGIGEDYEVVQYFPNLERAEACKDEYDASNGYEKTAVIGRVS